MRRSNTIKLPFSAFILICFSFCNHPSQNKTSVKRYFSNIDSLSTLSRLFTNSSIKGNHILWSPDYQDISSFSDILSSDSLCHTKIDTVLIADNIYYVIFRTDQYEKEIKANCHVCCSIVGIASFDKADNGFVLKNFVKNVFQAGSFGEYGSIEISDLCSSVIKVSSGWTGTGAEIDYEIYYDINDFSKLYYLNTFSSNGGNYIKGQPNYEETTKLISNKTDTSFTIETIKLFFDSLGKKTEIKYRDIIKLTNDIGGNELEMQRL